MPRSRFGAVAAILRSNELEDTQVEATVTSASVDNMYLIEDGGADTAFVLGDTTQDAVQGNAPFEELVNGVALATLYNNYTQIVVNSDSTGRETGVESLGSAPLHWPLVWCLSL